MTINVNGPDGTTVRFPDGTDTETINKVMAQHFGGAEAPSGVGAGLANGIAGITNSDAATAKDYFGLGDGPSVKQDPNYVPAQVINGLNPLKWNYDQIPQKVAEEAPGLTQHIIAGAAGAKAGKLIGGLKGAALGGILGSAASLWGSTAGDAANKDAVDRTGDQNATPNASDLTRAGLTSGASALAQAALPTRFLPGANPVASVGVPGLLQAAKKWGTTVGIGGATGAAGDAINQVGNTIGTDKGVQFDPSQNANAALGGAVTAGAMAAPGAVGDAYSAAARSKFGGANSAASEAYAQRLRDAAGADGLGKGTRDYAAQENTKAGLKKELQQVDDSGVSQDTANALALARSGKPLTSESVAAIEAHDPAAGHLARQLQMAQEAEKFGSYDTANKSWSGGLSGLADKYALRPFKAHLMLGGAATAMGTHMLGSYGMPFLGTAALAYGGARVADSVTGMRSPASEFAQRFNDANAMTRLPPQAPAPQPQAPAPQPAAPWGPRPAPTTSVPPVAPPMPQAPQPQYNPIALSMLKQTLKQGLPPAPQAPAPAPVAPQAPAINPLMLPRDITGPAKTLMAGFKNSGKAQNTYDTATRKAAGIAQAEELAQESPAINDQGGLSALSNPEFTKRGAQLLGAASVMKRLTAAPPEGEPAAHTLHSAATPPDMLKAAAIKIRPAGEAPPKTMADVLANATARAGAAKITKTNGKVSTEAPAAAHPAPWEPYPEEHLLPKDVSAQAYAAHEFANHKASSPKYLMKAEVSAQRRIDAANKLTAEYPQYKHAISGLLRQLHVIGNNPAEIASASHHYASLISDPAAAKAVREAFK